jgi:ankyrin repeat protein
MVILVISLSSFLTSDELSLRSLDLGERMFKWYFSYFIVLAMQPAFSYASEVNRQWNERVYNAIHDDDLKVLQDAVTAGYNFNEPDDKTETPLGYACGWGHLDVMDFILAHGGSVNARSSLGWAALFGCLDSQEKNIISAGLQFMVEHGADLKARANEGETVLFAASHSMAPETVNYLLTFPDALIGLNDYDKNLEQTVLLNLVQRTGGLFQDADWVAPVRAVLEKGANPDIARGVPALNYTFRTAFIQAGIPQLIIHLGAKRLDESDLQQVCHSPMCLAIRAGSVEILADLLDHGVKFDPSNRLIVDLWNESVDPEFASTRAPCFSLLAQRGLLPVNWIAQNSEHRISVSLLNWLIAYDQREGVKALIKQGANLTFESDGGKPLFAAVIGHDPEMVGILLDADSAKKIDQGYDQSMEQAEYSGAAMLAPFLSHHFDPNQTAAGQPDGCLLFNAVEQNDARALVKILLQYKADPNLPCVLPYPNHESALSEAVAKNDMEIINELIAARAKIGAFEMFAAASHITTLKFLVGVGGDPTVTDFQGQSLLHVAAANGNLDLFNYLIAIPNYPLDISDQYMETPLYLAAANGQADMASQLLDRGVSPNPGRGGRDDVLYQVLAHGYQDLALRILSKITTINTLDHLSYLRPAAAIGNTDIVSRLIAFGVDVKTYGALHAAAFYGNAATVTMLIKAGADANQTYVWGGEEFDPAYTPMFLAFDGGDFPEVVRALVHGGALFSDIFHAVETNRLESVKVIHELGGDLQAVQGTMFGVSRGTLHVAVQNNLMEMLKYLLSIGVDPNFKDSANCTALHYVFAGNGSAKTNELAKTFLDTLINGGADPNSTCDVPTPGTDYGPGGTGYTILMFAAMNYADLSLIADLLQHHAKPNSINSAGQTAITAMIIGDRVDFGMKLMIPIIRTLVAGGADINLAGPGTKTPLATVTALQYLKDKDQVIQAMIALGAHD